MFFFGFQVPCFYHLVKLWWFLQCDTSNLRCSSSICSDVKWCMSFPRNWKMSCSDLPAFPRQPRSLLRRGQAEAWAEGRSGAREVGAGKAEVHRREAEIRDVRSERNDWGMKENIRNPPFWKARACNKVWRYKNGSETCEKAKPDPILLSQGGAIAEDYAFDGGWRKESQGPWSLELYIAFLLKWNPS